MRNKIKHGLYKVLNRSGLRFVLAASAASIASVRMGKLCTVSYEGEWVQKFPSCTLVEPRLTLWTPQQVERHTAYFFQYQYLPKEGDIVVDVGAGTGWETWCFSRSVGKSGRVVSIEAHPTVFRCLSRMCAENRLENVTLIQAAVADHEGEVQFTDSPEHEANSMIGAVSGIRVPCMTLDHIFRSLGSSRVDFLKMNIEGAERLALSGMGEMARNTKNVCIACHDFLADEGGPNELRTRAYVTAFLKTNGFVVSLRESEGDFLRNFVYGRNEQCLPSQAKTLSS
jgi:FkbM family methyltransferase